MKKNLSPYFKVCNAKFQTVKKVVSHKSKAPFIHFSENTEHLLLIHSPQKLSNKWEIYKTLWELYGIITKKSQRFAFITTLSLKSVVGLSFECYRLLKLQAEWKHSP